MAITFRATSNKVKPQRNCNQWGPSPTLRDTMINSACFARTFPKGSEDGLARDGKALAEIIQSSTVSGSSEICHAPSGFLSSVVEAYNNHLNLTLRPDDVWQAILTQFAFYVNANAEELRHEFVDFEGKRQLTIRAGGTLFTADFGGLATRMVDEQIAKNLKDEEVAEWLVPRFTSTTPTDRIAASVTIMSTLQAYFEYYFELCCGIPNVTLEGTTEDWRLLRHKIDRLPKYDVEGKTPVMAKWHGLLSRVLDQFVASAEGRPDVEFWDKVCCHRGGGSGPSYLSGWATVFACFTDKGEWQGDVPAGDPSGPSFSWDEENDCLVPLAEESPEWPFINSNRIPIGVVSVPVLVNENRVDYDTQMFAGHFAYEMNFPSVRPRVDWCIAYKGQPK